MRSKVEIEEQPNPRDVATVRRGLDEYNLALAGDYNRKPLTVFLRGRNDEVIGGLLARTYWGYLYI
ncbi:MAG: GNAT family N-acetyltransferase, partial [Dehalococcoidia bacterium]